MTGPPMRLTVVGCSGSYPGPQSPCSCYLVEAEGGGRTWRALLDLGSGALGRLHDFVDPLSIDAVFLSHLHPDHWFDLSGYYVMRKYHPTGAPRRIPVYGPRGTARRMAVAYGLPPDPGMSEEFEVLEYDEATPVELGPLRFSVTRVVHPVEAFAIRVSAGDRSFVYSGDTAAAASLVDLAKGSDLLLAEASFQEGADNPADLHMTGREAARVAVESGVSTLVLTHVPPWYDPQVAFEEARPVFDGRLEIATSGATYDF
jgi:ribonuclease BN (tRNA processing enzyme)